MVILFWRKLFSLQNALRSLEKVAVCCSPQKDFIILYDESIKYKDIPPG